MGQKCPWGERKVLVPAVYARPKDPNEFGAAVFASIGIIGRADGPTAVLVGERQLDVKTAISSLRFTEPEAVYWQAVFNEKKPDSFQSPAEFVITLQNRSAALPRHILFHVHQKEFFSYRFSKEICS